MGFAQKGPQVPPTNYTARSAVYGKCRTTGYMPCTASVIWVNDSTSTTLPNIASFSFIQTPSGLYTEPYIYSLSLSNYTSEGFLHAAIVFTNSSLTYSFPLLINAYSSNNTYYSTFAPTSSGITTSQSNGSYYTINSGTYIVQIFNLPSNGGAPISNAQSYTFGTVTFSGSVPLQNITQN